MSYEQIEILLVEDCSDDAAMTLRTLHKRGIANRVLWVRDGVEALDFLFCEGPHAGRTDRAPKLVLLDLKMPRMGGLQVLERIKQDARTRAIPAVMMTSSRQEGDMLASYALGVNSFVVKPVEFDAFSETVAQVGMYWMMTNQTG